MTAISGLPVFLHFYLYADDFKYCYVDWGYNDNSPDSKCLAGLASINSPTLLYNANDAASFNSDH